MNLKKLVIPVAVLAIIGGVGYYIILMSGVEFSKKAADSGDVQESPERLMARAGWLTIRGKRDRADEIYERIVKEHTDTFFSKIAEARLRELGYERFFEGLDERNSDIYEVRSGDTLAKIAKQYGITSGLVRMANGLKNDTIRPYQKLKIMRDTWHIIADKSTNILILKAGDAVVKTYPVGTGKGGSTPVGEYKIMNRLKNPTWYYEGTVAASNAPDNPLGTRWMGFDLEGYGLHGTTDPESIGKYETLGCIRMFNEDVEEIFELLPVGTSVSVIESSLASGG